MAKTNGKKKENNILKLLKELIKINKRHVNESPSKLETRFWNVAYLVVGVLALIGIGTVANAVLSLSIPVQTTPEYAIKVEVSPTEIMLNEKGDKVFTFTFTNVGRKNISKFNIYKIRIYRLENGEYNFKNELSAFNERELYLSCGGYASTAVSLPVGKSCIIEDAKMSGCPTCFDDKDKPVFFFIDIHSIPPTGNQIVNLRIY